MKTATLYIRVSTDEQATKGYSQRNQHERLVKFCRENSIEILNVIFEDHSAKTFIRPAWVELLKTLRKNKAERPEQILFTRWDRFSRNSADAYYMLSELRKMNIDVQAIEQLLDLSIPENKLMLALYLAVSEVENDRRSLNIKQGIHKARQEGRYIGRAPLGYTNRISEAGRKFISPNEPDANIIRDIFLHISTDYSNISSVHKKANEMGLKCGLNNFYSLIKNPVYCGKIIIPKFENEKSYMVKGIHEPLIQESLFNRVQEILKSEKKSTSQKLTSDDNLLFRGILQCTLCGKTLTGSSSKGRNSRYHYYHCQSGCGFRVRADKLENQFISELESFVPQKAYVKLYRLILQQTYDRELKKPKEQVKATKNVTHLFNRTIRARDLLYAGEIDNDDYLLIKTDCESKINTLGIDLNKSVKTLLIRSKSIVSQSKKLSQIGGLYRNSVAEIRKQIVALLLPNKSVLEGSFKEIVGSCTKIIYGLDTDSSDEIEVLDKNEENNREKEENCLYESFVKNNLGSRRITFMEFQRISLFLEKFDKIVNGI